MYGGALGDYLRQCDICGRTALRHREMRKRDDGSIECDLHYNERTVQALDRRAANVRPVIIPPTPDRRYNDVVPTFEVEEGKLLAYVIARTGTGTQLHPDGWWGWRGEQWWTMGEAARYLRNLISENTRPKHWITAAKVKLRDIADLTLLRQYGAPEAAAAYNAAGIADLAWYGAVTSTVAAATGVGSNGMLRSAPPGSNATPGAWVHSASVAQAGLALAYAFEILGDAKYRDGARRAATCMRRMQCGDLLTSNFASSDSAGTSRWHSGMWVHQFSIGASADFSLVLQVSDLIGLEFLSELKRIDGEATYGDAAAVGQFVSGTAATLTTMIAEAKAFWVNGAKAASTGTVSSGFSTTNPANYFNGFPDGDGNWFGLTDNVGVDSRSFDTEGFCIALRAWYALYGNDTTHSAVYSWLRGFKPNPNHATTSSNPASHSSATIVERLKETNGTYDPTLCIAQIVHLAGADSYSTNDTLDTEATLSGYWWANAGYLAKAHAVLSAGTFKTMRDTVSEMRPWKAYSTEGESTLRSSLKSAMLGAQVDLRLLGETGMSYQMQRFLPGPTWEVEWPAYFMAPLGDIYRQAPRARSIV